MRARRDRDENTVDIYRERVADCDYSPKLLSRLSSLIVYYIALPPYTRCSAPYLSAYTHGSPKPASWEILQQCLPGDPDHSITVFPPLAA